MIITSDPIGEWEVKKVNYDGQTNRQTDGHEGSCESFSNIDIDTYN